jgi:hypothetical protein
MFPATFIKPFFVNISSLSFPFLCNAYMNVNPIVYTDKDDDDDDKHDDDENNKNNKSSSSNNNNNNPIKQIKKYKTLTTI